MKAKHFKKLVGLFQSIEMAGVLMLFLAKHKEHKDRFEYDLKELEKDSYLNEERLMPLIKRLIDEDFLSHTQRFGEDKSYYMVNINEIFDYVLDENEMLELL